MLIPRVTESMLRNQPDQFIRTINAVIDELNRLSLQNKK